MDKNRLIVISYYGKKLDKRKSKELSQIISNLSRSGDYYINEFESSAPVKTGYSIQEDTDSVEIEVEEKIQSIPADYDVINSLARDYSYLMNRYYVNLGDEKEIAPIMYDYAMGETFVTATCNRIRNASVEQIYKMFEYEIYSPKDPTFDNFVKFHEILNNCRIQVITK